jgi:hypothetical protein
MTTRNDLVTAIRRWLKEAPGAVDMADWILRRAEAKGRVPKQLTCPVDERRHAALVSFFSDRYVRLGSSGTKCRLLFERWENETLGQSGWFVSELAAARGRTLRNRQREKEDRANRIGSLMSEHASREGLPGFVARRELDALSDRKGRFWYRSGKQVLAQIDQEIQRYFALLQYVEFLRRDPSRIERVVHVSREIAGDTHWLRTASQVWRDLADDVLQFDPLLNELTAELADKQRAAHALKHIGLAENLTSVAVLVFGRFSLRRSGAQWRWATEAAEQQVPVWLTAQQLLDAEILPVSAIRRVISVENETSFLDLIESRENTSETILVYTEGHANRAVVALLRLIAQTCPNAGFHHQGDLDLYGVRILASLVERSGLAIEPMYMDAATHQRFEASGIRLTDQQQAEVEHAIAKGMLPCQDMLQRIAATGLWIEQEAITATNKSRVADAASPDNC